MLLSDIATIVTAAVSLALAIYTILATRRNERDLERLKSELAEKQADRDARRDYEYEARKRLYTEFEPLFFQFIEAARAARNRIRGLASTARRGNLDPGASWLGDTEGYYLVSTVYSICAPLAWGRLLQQQLTFVDLAVDKKIRTQYEVIRRLMRVLAHDYELASQNPTLKYAPNRKDAEQLSATQPEVYKRQGVFAGYLDVLADSFIVGEHGASRRCLSFGEFERMREDSPDEFRRRFRLAIELFLDFQPHTRPVLWRALVAHYLLYRWLQLSVDLDELKLPPHTMLDLHEEQQKLDWRKPGSTVSDEEALVEPFSAIETYFASHFAN
jgi:hypothetical protein